MGMHGLPPGLTNPPAPLPAESDETQAVVERGAPGTLVLVFVFLVAFIVYYFVNWNLLSFLWRIG